MTMLLTCTRVLLQGHKRVWSHIIGEVLELVRKEGKEHGPFAVCHPTRLAGDMPYTCTWPGLSQGTVDRTQHFDTSAI